MTIKFKPRPLLLVVLLAVILLILGISWVYLASPVDKNDKKDIQMKKYFSISKAIRNACTQYKGDTSKDFETQIIADNKRSLGIGEEYDVVISRRALAPTATNGQELITGEYLPQEFVPALRPATALSKTGYRIIPSTGHSVSFAVVTQGSTAKMYDLDGNLEDGDLKFATKELKPRKARSLCSHSLFLTFTS